MNDAGYGEILEKIGNQGSVSGGGYYPALRTIQKTFPNTENSSG